MRPTSVLILMCAGALAVPATVRAQASISGLVQDASGAVIPGVTVEASSPALIERVRTAVTDAAGRYTIVDLRPGLYDVTFSLPGFATIKREGITLEGAFTAQVNAELRVGAVEETVTVSGQAPVVDVQSTRQQTVINRELLDVLPTGRTLLGRASVLPGLTTNRTSAAQVIMSVHGSPSADAYTYLDGVRSGHVLLGSGAVSGGPGSSQFVDSAQAEVTFDTGAQSAEMQVGGVRMNAIPREGGNTFAGSVFLDAGGSALQGNNQTPGAAGDDSPGQPDRVHL